MVDKSSKKVLDFSLVCFILNKIDPKYFTIEFIEEIFSKENVIKYCSKKLLESMEI